MNDRIEKLEQAILAKKHWLVVSHLNPDGDALGSTLAVKHILEQWNIEHTCLNLSQIPNKYQILPGIDQIYQPTNLDETFDAVIFVDAADRERIGIACEQCIKEDAFIINIDHHATNDQYGMINWVETEASATAEIIYQWVEYSNRIDWNSFLATSVYTGILTDTGGFRYSNTTPDVMRYASNLLEKGVQGHELADILLETTTLPALELLQRALTHLQVDGSIAWTQIDQHELNEANAVESDTAGIVNYARNLEGVDVGILFREVEPDVIKVSLRSRLETDVASIASYFGGGGHTRAAGCTIKGKLPQVVERVIKHVQKEQGRA
ncbi:phosphoesterase RecJ domain-containing protein [Seinonella peptonophila]|uniref:Phosphoesterase RecJ domain-containing protein n=1 Tax=Seinonella peptonophila TaxID=112248 RepID=A0A1M5APV5_9BACL|nr:bifunctional oligoribonuclease/PAP phosphatase NrnA [Seinonella peptonophila]SHF32280.1 phosphoesterase RecJ domain-containing protein [Seinonella peptonophila]